MGKNIVTTYDSRKIKEVLVADGEDLVNWMVVVDEFQAMFYDCQFKPTMKYEFGQIRELSRLWSIFQLHLSWYSTLT